MNYSIISKVSMYSMLLLSVSSMFLKGMKYMVSFLVVMALLCMPYLSGTHSHKMFFHKYFMSLDNLSTFLMMLTVWMTLLMCLSMKKAKKVNNLFLSFTMLNFVLVFSFISNSLLGFYIFFELSLIPTLIMMLGWGIQPERILAGSYLMMYTLVGSLPLLGALLFMDFHCGTLKVFMPMADMYFFNNSDYSMFCMFWMSAFLMKLPIYGIHLWLPKAHVEAPVAGSMILAGVLLKLGAYGLVRSLHFLDLNNCKWGKLLFMWSVVTMCVVGFMCFRQCDLKSLVAYSSVAHMSLILAACFSCDIIGIKGMVGMLVSHGLCSSALFFGVQFLYENSGSRKMFLNRGLMSLSPMFSFFWFMLCVGKASAPPSLNLLSEFFLMSGMVKFGGAMSAVFCALSMFLGGLFSMYLYVLVCHGKWSSGKGFWSPPHPRHLLMLFLHALPLYSLLFLSNYMFFVM